VRAGYVYHVLNRGYGRMTVLKDAAFERVLEEAAARCPGVRILAYCLMPNHWHLVLHPTETGEPSRFVGWLTLPDTQRWHAHRHTAGDGPEGRIGHARSPSGQRSCRPSPAADPGEPRSMI